MRKNAFVLIAAIFVASVTTSVNAEILSSDGVTYSYGSESLQANPYSSTNYGAVEYVYQDETALASPVEYIEYQTYGEQFSVAEEPYVTSYETLATDLSDPTVFNTEYGQNGIVSEVIDGIVYETVVSTETPVFESGQIFQTY